MLTTDHLKRALTKAMQCTPDGASPGAQHQARSQEWVKCLAAELKSLYPSDSVKAFHKGDSENRGAFGLNELLYDICICETATCSSASKTRELRFVTKALWQVESEFARDSFEAIKDFNKLVIGAADNKLFIGPRLSPAAEPGYLQALLPVAKCCRGSGQPYIALVPHPSEWKTETTGIAAWRLDGDHWQQI